MATHIIGFKPPDEQWQKMRAVWDACTAAGIPMPERVERFFEEGPPDPNGVEVWLRNTSAVREWSDRRCNGEGYEVLLDKLSPDIKVIRFYNSY